MKILPSAIKEQSIEFWVSEDDIKYFYSEGREALKSLYKKYQTLIHQTRDINTKKFYGRKRNFLQAIYSFDE